MSESKGTLELLALELGKLFTPLEQKAESGNILALFAEMGVQFPEELLDHSGFTDAVSNVISIVISLAENTEELTTAIDEENADEAVEAGLVIIGLISDLITAIQTLSDELNSLAGTISGISADDIRSFAEGLPVKLLNFLIITYLEDYRPLLASLMEFVGVIEKTAEQEDSEDETKPSYVHRVLNLSRLADLLNSPGELFEELYSWGQNDANTNLLIEKVSRMLGGFGIPNSIHIPSAEEEEQGHSIRFASFRFSPDFDLSPPGFEASIFDSRTGGLTFIIPFIIDEWNLQLTVKGDMEAGASLTFQPPANIEYTPVDVAAGGEVGLALVRNSSEPLYLLGKSGGTRLQVSDITFSAGVSLDYNSSENKATGSFFVEASLEGGKLVISPGGADSFLGGILPADAFEADFDFKVGISGASGFYFSGSSALEINLPTHISVGVIELESLTFALKPDNGDLPIELGASFKTELGPLTVVVENMGLKATFSFPDGGGNLGPADMDIGFKPPNGLGLSIDGGGIKGGGHLYFDTDEGSYSGAIELEFQETLALKAIGLLSTRLPDGSDGFSLLIIISAEFTPIQLGYGFTLNGVGGLLGLHRTADTDRLRTGVKDGTIDNILFPTDVIANANQILSDVGEAFPVEEDRFIFGPMAKIGWGTPTLITLEMGIIIELPDPITIAILGVIKALLPDEDFKLLSLQVNFLGVIDFEKKELSFDASIYDSFLLSFTLSGDMAVRLAWGNNANFILTVGGFNPSYEPPPLALDDLERLTVSLLSGNNPRLTLEVYFAVTSNSVQFGTKLELYAEASKFNVYGFMSFDVLFQFSPFYFIASISAMLAVRLGKESLMSVKLSLTLEGPTPWKADGTAKFEVLFVTINVRFSKTFGDSKDTSLPDIEILPLLEDAINNKGNWEAEIPSTSNLLVSLKEISETGEDIIAHPFGVLKVSQKVVPLDIEIDTYGNQKPADDNYFEISQITSGDETLSTSSVKESFAPAQYFDMKDSEKLSGNSFEEYISGVKITSSEELQSSYYVKKDVEYELSYIDSTGKLNLWPDFIVLDSTSFGTWLKGGSVGRSRISHSRNAVSPLAPQAVSAKTEEYAVVNNSNLALYDDNSWAGSEAEADHLLAELVTNNPGLANELQIVPKYEVNES